MKLKLPKEKQELYDKLAEPLKEEFLAEMNEERKNLMLKSITLTTLLLESFDDLEEFGMFRAKLKEKGKMFRHQATLYVKQVWKVEENLDEGADYLVKMSQKIDELFKLDEI